MENMTILSRQQLESALHLSTISEAANALLHYQHFRTLGDVLRSFCSDPKVKETLVDGLMLWFPESKRDTIDRKVRNWLAGRNKNIEKEIFFILSHILNLDLEQTNDFLKKAMGEGIHWRDPEDIVWSYAILHRLSPDSVRNLLKQARALYDSADGEKPNVAAGYTAEVFGKLQPALYGTEEDLLAFLSAEQASLGAFHNTAHQTFMNYIRLLEQGFSEDDIETQFREMTLKEKKKKEEDAADRKETARKEAEKAAEEAGIPYVPEDPDKPITFADLDGDTELYQPDSLTTRDVLETYLYRSLVPSREDKTAKKQDPFFAIRHSIRQNWPDEVTISKMKNRQIDISRKVLILLFLATDGSNSDFGNPEDEEFEEYEEDYTRDDAFQDLYTRLNLMLNACGFLQLDPRSAFDWMILFCISSGDLWDSDARIQEMLTQMFPDEDE